MHLHEPSSAIRVDLRGVLHMIHVLRLVGHRARTRGLRRRCNTRRGRHTGASYGRLTDDLYHLTRHRISAWLVHHRLTWSLRRIERLVARHHHNHLRGGPLHRIHHRYTVTVRIYLLHHHHARAWHASWAYHLRLRRLATIHISRRAVAIRLASRLRGSLRRRKHARRHMAMIVMIMHRRLCIRYSTTRTLLHNEHD